MFVCCYISLLPVVKEEKLLIPKSVQASPHGLWVLLHHVHQIHLHWFPWDEYLAESNSWSGIDYYRTNAFNSIETKDVYFLPYLNTII